MGWLDQRWTTGPFDVVSDGASLRLADFRRTGYRHGLWKKQGEDWKSRVSCQIQMTKKRNRWIDQEDTMGRIVI